MRFPARSHLSACLLACALAQGAQAGDAADVRDADARFWRAYNACDLPAMGALLTDDVEFYHDRTGLTASRTAVVESLRKGPCGEPAMRLRREAVAGSVQFHPLAGGYAILSGRHRFFVRPEGEPERLDGEAGFTDVWKADAGRWRMHRILSFDHGAPAYVPPATHLSLPADALAQLAGRYRGERVGEIVVTAEADGLRLVAGPMTVRLRAQAPDLFFALERDLRFRFDRPGGDARSRRLTVLEHGAPVETAQRIE